MSEQNNNTIEKKIYDICGECKMFLKVDGICHYCTHIACSQCGNIKEPNGKCFDCEIRPNIVYKECGVCYEDRDCERFDVGVNCEHSVCVYCSERITKCPFCRKRWMEYEDSDEEEEEEEEDEQCDICGRPATNGLIDDHFICIECRDEELERRDEELERSQVFNSVRSLQVLYQVRADDEFIDDNEGDWQFTTEEHARDIFSNAMDDIRAGNLDAERLRITRTPLLNEDEWNELFEDEPYPDVITIDEWNRPEDQDDFENRICGFCSKDFLLSDPHFYSEETDECYCNEECYRKEQEEEE
jgi:hypothetical protein